MFPWISRVLPHGFQKDSSQRSLCWFPHSFACTVTPCVSERFFPRIFSNAFLSVSSYNQYVSCHIAVSSHFFNLALFGFLAPLALFFEHFLIITFYGKRSFRKMLIIIAYLIASISMVLHYFRILLSGFKNSKKSLYAFLFKNAFL